MADETNERAVQVEDVTAGLPEHVSPSQVSTFTSCGLKYYFVSVLGWQEPPTEASATGDLTHDTLENLYKLPPAERTRDRARELLTKAAEATLTQPRYKHLRLSHDVAAASRAAVANAFVLETPTALDVLPEDIEANVRADIDGVTFGGRLDRRTRGAVPRITDYKSGKRPAPAFLEGKLRQLYLYAAADEINGTPVDEVELLFLGSEPGRVRRPVYPAVIDEAKATLTTMRADAEAAVESSTFVARRSGLCAFCKFKRACPLFANAAPPPGSPDSTLVLEGLGLTKRARRKPEPLEPLIDTDEDLT